MGDEKMSDDLLADFEHLEGREAHDAFVAHLAQCVRDVRPGVTPEELTRALAAALAAQSPAHGVPSPVRKADVHQGAQRGLSFLLGHGSKIWGVASILHAAGLTRRGGRAMTRRLIPLVLLFLAS